MGITRCGCDSVSAARAVLKVLLVGQATLGAVTWLLERGQAGAVGLTTRDAGGRGRGKVGRGVPHANLLFLGVWLVFVTGPDERWLAAAVRAVRIRGLEKGGHSTARTKWPRRMKERLPTLTPIANSDELFEATPGTKRFGLAHLRIQKSDFNSRSDPLPHENVNDFCDRRHVDGNP